MGFIFNSNNFGRISAIHVPEATESSLLVLTPGLPDLETVVVTSIGYSQDVNVQFSPSLMKKIYVYSFGDRMGSIVISGLLFSKGCEETESFSGLKGISEYYKTNRASKSNTPVSVVIGGSVNLRGFLIGLRVDTENAELGALKFMLSMTSLP